MNHPSSIINNQWEAPPFHGEFGWEVMSWSPWCRARSREHERTVVTTFAGMAPLYEDFAEVRDHGSANRTLDYPKSFAMYRSDGNGFEHRRYGDPDRAEPFDVLIHARGIRRKSGINYRRWLEVAAVLVAHARKAATIGTAADQLVPGTRDLRDLSLARLMDLMAAADVTAGASSGVMHLAAACGCDLVVWGDNKTRYNETLEKRYKQTWNPHHVRVEWLSADDWQPDPSRILSAIEQSIIHHQ